MTRSASVPIVAAPTARGPLVYWLYDADGAVVYVGATRLLLSKRLAEHRTVRVWWDEVDAVAIQKVALHELAAAEAAAIQADQPRYNRTAGRYRQFPVPEPERRPRVGKEAFDAAWAGPGGKAGFLNRFAQLVDPDGMMPARERQRRLAAAEKAWDADLSLRRLRTRRAREAAA